MLIKSRLSYVKDVQHAVSYFFSFSTFKKHCSKDFISALDCRQVAILEEDSDIEMFSFLYTSVLSNLKSLTSDLENTETLLNAYNALCDLENYSNALSSPLIYTGLKLRKIVEKYNLRETAK